jgi:hypothetical protein
MDFYVSPVTLLFESSLISIVSLTPEQQLLINTRTNNMENKEKKVNKVKNVKKEEKEKKHKLKKD